jgi:hypothetical protein
MSNGTWKEYSPCPQRNENQLDNLHVWLGSARTFVQHVLALKALGVDGSIPSWPMAIRNILGRRPKGRFPTRA